MTEAELYLKRFVNIGERGRVAFAAACLERAHLLLENNFPLIKQLLDHLWDFAMYHQLSEWDDEFRVIVHQIEIHFAEKSIREKIYPLCEIADLCYEISIANAYGAFDNSSYKCLGNLIEIMLENEIELPNADLFAVFKTSDEHGWGNAMDTSEIRHQVSEEL